MPSSMISFAAVAIAIMPDEHCRSSDIAGTLSGSPARSALWRATLKPCAPCCDRRADDHVVDLAGLDAGALDRLGDRVPGQRLRHGVVEGAAIGPADRRARGGNDDGVTHGVGSSGQGAGRFHCRSPVYQIARIAVILSRFTAQVIATGNASSASRPPASTGSASIRMKAKTHGSEPVLTQACIVPRCTHDVARFHRARSCRRRVRGRIRPTAGSRSRAFRCGA